MVSDCFQAIQPSGHLSSVAIRKYVFAIVILLSLVSLFYSFREVEHQFIKRLTLIELISNDESATVVAGSIQTRGLKSETRHAPNTRNIASHRRLTCHGLNVHEWNGLCADGVKNLCDHPFYPTAASRRYFANTTEFTPPTEVSGQRIFGFVHPPTSGAYTFQLITNDAVEAKLGQNEFEWHNSMVLFNRLKGAILTQSNSVEVFLNSKETYFLDIVHILRRKGNNYLRLLWKIPKSSSFELMDNASLSVFTDDSAFHKNSEWDERIPLGLVCSRWRADSENKFMKYDKDKHYFLSHDQVKEALPECYYRPSYIQNRTLGRYHGISYSRPLFRSVLPRIPNMGRISFLSQDQLNRGNVTKVVDSYMVALESRYPRKFILNSIINVEKKEDIKGDRYLLELQVFVVGQEGPRVLSEYIFRHKQNNSLCYPREFQWQRNSTLYFIVTVKNQGLWIHHFLDNMAHIVKETRDPHIRVVVFDYNSTDIKMRDALERSRLPYQLVIVDGSYSRSESFNAAVKVISDPNAIAVLMDLHMDIGSGYVNEIRKRTIQGRAAYVPIIVRLRCGASSLRPRGFWETLGYGLVSAYKSDWERIGGFEEDERKHSWGGEDWQLIDRVVGKGLEMERLRCPYVYHNHHPKLGWNNK